MVVAAQQPIAARSNVVPYYDEASIEKDAYRESPYYQELSGTWKQRETDSSIIYSRSLETEKSWKDYQVFLNVRCGRAVRLLLNGKVLGYGGDSRHWNEFLLNGFLKYGKVNDLTIEAMKHSDEALLEDSALCVGLNGTPYLIFKNDPNISDMTLLADYNAATSTGTFSLSTMVYCGKRKGKYYVEAVLWDPRGREFDRMGRWVVFNGKNEEIVDMSRSWTGVEAWNAENPTLYTLVVRLRNEKMEEEEVVGQRFGFRSVEVRDGVLLLNGKAITISGVTYGLEHTEGYASREQMKRDVLTMKRNNVNAVRTSRFSPMDPYFYELCDYYGLYVVADANLMPLSEQHRALATEQEFIPLFQRRVEHLYGKYKNYTSIILWSLGNTRDNGVCMTAAYKWLKSLDNSRPVVFPGAGHGESTDIIAPDYPTQRILKQSLAKQGNRPYLMFSAVDATNFSDLEPLWQLVGHYRQLQGGFVDIWPLTTSMQSELKHLFSPFDVKLSKMMPDEGEFVVSNRRDFSTFAGYSLEYNIFTNRRASISGGELPVAIRPGESEKVSMLIPQVDLQAGEELFIRFDLNQNTASRHSWQSSADLRTGTVIFPLSQRQQPKRMLVNNGSPLQDTVSENTLTLPQLFFVGHEDWVSQVIDRFVRQPDKRTHCIDYMLRYSSPDGSIMCDVRFTYTQFSTGDHVLDYTIAPTDRLVGGVLKPALKIDWVSDSVTWYGLDREVYFLQRNAAVHGIYRHSSNGISRGEVRWCALFSSEKGLYAQVLDQRCLMSADNNQLVLIPSDDNHFRLYLRPFRNENPMAFYGQDFPRMMTGVLEPPAITASDVRFSQPLSVTITSSDKGQIRYTLDGSEPTETSPLYTTPLELAATTIVKARVFSKGMPPSFTTTRKFNYDHIVKTTFSRKPNTPYNVGADTLLFDGDKGIAEELTRGWLGFSGGVLQITIQLAKPVDVEALTLRFAHNPSLWAFAPRNVSVSGSSDGVSYADARIFMAPFAPDDQENDVPQVVTLRLPVKEKQVGFLRIDLQPIERLPAWHRGKGLKPWLMIDEIEIEEMIENK